MSGRLLDLPQPIVLGVKPTIHESSKPWIDKKFANLTLSIIMLHTPYMFEPTRRTDPSNPFRGLS